MKRLSMVLVLVAIAAGGAIAGYQYAMTRAGHAAPPTAATDKDRKVLYWYDPMQPQHKFDKPGKSPFMDMQLVPKYADEEPAGTVSISPQVVQNLGVRIAEAQSGSLETRFEAVGSVAYNERGVVQLQARAAGFVERLYARAPLDAVRKGAALVDILYPEWAGAQEEFLFLLKSTPSLAPAARQRLALLGMSEAEISAVEADGKVRARHTLIAPISGVVAELGVREGMTIAPGAPLFKLVDLSKVWVNAEVAEAQAAWLRPGARVEARVAAYAERKFDGRVGAILPELSATTRTIRARIELDNPDSLLKPGMFATLVFRGERGRKSVLVPSEAVIRTGSRDVVILALGDGKFRSVPVEIGAEAGGQSEIRKGVQAGEKVVLSGQFLIDSEASLGATLARLEGSAAMHKGRGKVHAVDVKAGRIELEHGPIPSLQWPSMTMEFTVKDKSQLGGLKPGDVVEFEVRPQPDQEGSYLLPRIAKAAGQ